MKLSDKVFKLVKGDGIFDYWLKLKDAEKRGKWYAKLVFTKVVRLEGKEPKGIDVGYRKLITTSDGEVYGKHIKEIIERIANKV